MVIGGPGSHGDLAPLLAPTELRQELGFVMIQSQCLEEPTVPQIHLGLKCGLLLTIQLRKLIIKTAKKVHVQVSCKYR